MAKVETYSCDQCGAQKLKGNGWFCARISNPRKFFTIMQWEDREDTAQEYTFQDSSNLRVEEKHYCSESCVAKAFSKAMGSGILAASADSNS